MRRGTRVAIGIGSIVAVGAVAAVATRQHATRHAAPARSARQAINYHSKAVIHEKLGSGEAEQGGLGSPIEQTNDNRAYPASTVAPRQAAASRAAFVRAYGRTAKARATARHRHLAASATPLGGQWKDISPNSAVVPAPVTYTGKATTNAGRVTTILVDRNCAGSDCRVWVGAAGGGVWATENGLANSPEWKPASVGLTSNAIGSLLQDPTDRTGRTLYVGTGEPNGSGDSEAGVGLFKSTDLGAHWTLVPGSVPVSAGRSIATVAVDPANARHILIGTAVARAGNAAVQGGRFTPAGAPDVGIYESTDGGATFALAFSQPGDTVIPGTSNGTDFFAGGIDNIQFDRTALVAGQPSRAYASTFAYGVWRSDAVDEAGDAAWKPIFTSPFIADSAASRSSMALAPIGSKLRIYVGDAGYGPPPNYPDASALFRVDDANVPAGSLTDGTNNPGWTSLSDPTPGTPGNSSWSFCGGQCSYDMPVASPPGAPDNVWIGGQMQYDEIFTAHQPSNGRAVQRSTDAGASFTDMTNDATGPAPLGMHPDQHAIAFVPGHPDIAFLGSDGGVVRTSGSFVDTSADCDLRGLVGPQLSECKNSLKAIPTRIFSLNQTLRTLQFQSLTVSPTNPEHDIIGGTQDNGTWALDGSGAGFESVGGDGGLSAIDRGGVTRIHTYYDAQVDVNFNGNDPLAWDWISDPFFSGAAAAEARSFYIPVAADQAAAGTLYAGLGHVYRTRDNGGDQAAIAANCNELAFTGAIQCGDWTAMGENLATGSFTVPAGTPGRSGASFVAVIQRATDASTMWAATRRGRIFVSKNVNAADADVHFNRIDTAATPGRFISGITVDPKDANHAWITYSGYDAYSLAVGGATGHVLEARYNPATGSATFTNLSMDIGDTPVLSIARDARTGDLYAGTDWGVLRLARGGSSWQTAGVGMPPVQAYSVAIAHNTLYVGTHGRGAWTLALR